MKLKVAAAQLNTVVGGMDARLDQHCAMIKQAREAGVGVLLFPELSLSGYNTRARTLDLALRRDDPRITEIARASEGMVTVFGFVEEGFAAQFYNSVVAVRDGKVIYIYRKINLATYGALEEGKHFATGRYVETFDLGEPWRVSVLICSDLWNPALVNLVALHGTTLLLAPISSAIEAVGGEFDNPGGWGTCLSFYSMIYGFPVVMANRIGKEGDLTFWGGSRILDPFGKVISEATQTDDHIVLAELDYEEIRRARYYLPTVRDSNLGLVLRESERLYQIIGVPEAVRETP